MTHTIHRLAINEHNDWEALAFRDQDGNPSLIGDDRQARELYEALQNYFDRGTVDPEPVEIEELEHLYLSTWQVVRRARELGAPVGRTDDQIANTLRKAARDKRHNAHQSINGDWWFNKHRLDDFLIGVRWRDTTKELDPEPEPATKLHPSDYEITNGYVSSLGVTYKVATEESLAEAIAAAAIRNNKSEVEIMQLLASGKNIAWCDSPNHYYDHGTGIIRRKRTPAPVQLVKCACGHSVPRSQVMSASRGTSCADCYDRMSD